MIWGDFQLSWKFEFPSNCVINGNNDNSHYPQMIGTGIHWTLSLCQALF